MDPEGGEFQLMSRRVLGTNTHLGDTAAQVLAQAQKSPNEPQPL